MNPPSAHLEGVPGCGVFRLGGRVGSVCSFTQSCGIQWRCCLESYTTQSQSVSCMQLIGVRCFTERHELVVQETDPHLL